MSFCPFVLLPFFNLNSQFIYLPFSGLPFCLFPILSLCHLVYLSLWLHTIFPACPFALLSICPLSICNFVNLQFCQFTILPFVNLQFCQFATFQSELLSICPFVYLPFCLFAYPSSIYKALRRHNLNQSKYTFLRIQFYHFKGSTSTKNKMGYPNAKSDSRVNRP
jgi:hypothetical protein